eukprot:645833-Amphidinium_carterae.2
MAHWRSAKSGSNCCCWSCSKVPASTFAQSEGMSIGGARKSPVEQDGRATSAWTAIGAGQPTRCERLPQTSHVDP